MSRKQEALSEASSLSLVLSAVAQSMLTTAGTLDTCSPSQKVEMLELMAQVIDAVTEVLAASLEQSKQTLNENS